MMGKLVTTVAGGWVPGKGGNPDGLPAGQDTQPPDHPGA